jgi:alpha-L-fucosidase
MMAAAIAMMPGSASAAPITWGAVSVFNDATDVNANGLPITVAAGANWAGTVNGVTFTDEQPGTLSGFDFDYYAVGTFMNDTGSSPEANAFDALVGATSYDAATTTITLLGLTNGQAYRLQCFIVDDRGAYHTRTQNFGDLDGGTPSVSIVRGNTGTLTSGNTIYGDFTADADGIQEFTVIGTDTMLTGYVLTTNSTLNVTLNSPANNQTYLSGTSISATAAVASGTAPHTVKFFTRSLPGGSFAQAGGDLTTPPYTLDLGALTDGSYEIYATVTDSEGPADTATSATHTFTVAPPVDMDVRAGELKSLGWGMFICWSFSTFSGVEWTAGVTDVDFFSATDCDTDQWVRTAKEAGMGYILFLTKHHDGFCLWDTQTTERKVTNAPLGRDVLAELKQSCDKYGIKLALYFSEGEFDDNSTYHPGGYTPEMKRAQLKELLTQYGPIEYIWFDHAAGTGGVNHVDTVIWCHQWQPGTLIGFNFGDPAGEISLRERGGPGPLGDPGFLLAEFTYPILPDHVGGADWFYSLPIHDNLCHPAEKLYSDYLGALEYGNIFSINVGPDYNGRLRDIDVATLRQVGAMIQNPPIPPLSEDKPAQASSVWGPGYEAGKAVDGDTSTRWGAAPESRSGWVEVDLQEEATVGRAVVMEIGYPRTQVFAIEYKSGATWQPIVTGTTLAACKLLDFSPVTARYWRLNILQAIEVPTIEEFQLLPPEFAASTASSSQINLTWGANGANSTGFVIERSLTAGTGFAVVGNVGVNATSWSDTNVVPGTTYYYSVSATSPADHTPYTMQASATAWTVLEAWRKTQWGSITNTGNAEDTADPDADSLSNLIEFAIGTDPQVAAQPGPRLSSSLVTVSAARRMSLTFARRNTAAGITYVVETSRDLSAWSANAIQLGAPADNGDGTETVTFYDPSSVSPGEQHRFIRLRVTSNP